MNKDITPSIKQKKKRILIIVADIVAIILLIAICLIAFRSCAYQKRPTETKPNESIAASVILSSTENTVKVSVTKSSDVATSKTDSTTKLSSNKGTPISSKNKSTSSSSINVQSETKQLTGYGPLDKLTNSILSRITDGASSTNDKLKAIYNYVRNNITYNMFPHTTKGLNEKLISLGYSEYDSSQIALAFDTATYHEGVCDNYAALTMILARAAGIPVNQCGGLSSSGSSHAWNTIVMDGEKYLIDANYGFFLKRFSDSGYTEQMDGTKFFNNFKTTVPKKDEKKISWMFNAGFGSQRFLGNDRGNIKQTATIKRPMYASPDTLYPDPITPMVTCEGKNNTFSATVSSGGNVIETLKNQSGDNKMYYFSWYPPKPGVYVIDIKASSDDVFTGHFIINATITS